MRIHRLLSRKFSSLHKTTLSNTTNQPLYGFLGCIGKTPLIPMKSFNGCKIYGKAEFLNPGGSVKDRTASHIIQDAEDKGILKPGGTIVEGTAGNTGIGLAHICNAKGYKCIIYMPNTQSQEKMNLLRILGAEVRPVPLVPYSDPKNYNHQAKECAQSLPNAVWTNQFDNIANREVHYTTTGPEIYHALDGKLDAFVCSVGTGGTLAGISRYLLDQNDKKGSKTKIYLADPPGSVLYSYFTQGKLEKTGESSITEGIGQGRITDNFKGTHIDGAFHVEDHRTIAMIYRLMKDEGLFLGTSSALNVVAAYDLASQMGPGCTIATILCDSASRYQTRLFSKKWLEANDLLDAVPQDCKNLVVLP